MDTPLNPRLQATAKLFRPAGLLGLCPPHHQNKLYQNLPPILPHAYWPEPRALVKANEVPWHQCPVGSLMTNEKLENSFILKY